MPTYARSDLCPDCGTVLEGRRPTCERCGLPLRHPLADELLATLRHADVLLLELRAAAAPTPALRPLPAPSQGARTGRLGQASVPRLLLSLGAACLLVAAVVFLAVAWSWLGVGGRTAVLVTLTVAAGAAATLLARRGLVAAAEALSAVALGLLVLDVLGAGQSGWAPPAGTAASGVVVGVALVVGALGLAGLHLGGAGTRPVVPQVVPAVGLLVTGASAATAVAGDGPVGVWVAALLAAGLLVLLGTRASLPVLRTSAGAAGALAWGAAALVALADGLDDMSLLGLYAHGGAWWLVAVSGLALLPLLDRRVRTHALAVVPMALSVGVLTLTVLLPVLDEGPDPVLAACAGAVVLGSLVSLAVRVRPVLARAVVAVAVAFAGPVVVATGVLVVAAGRGLLTVAPAYDAAAGVRVSVVGQPWDPRLLVPAVAALGLLVLVLVPRDRWQRALPVLGGAVAASGLGTAALLGAPLGVVVLPLALAASVLVVAAHSDGRRVTGLTAGLAAAALALPSAVLAAIALGVLTVALAARTARHAARSKMLEAALPVALAAWVWSVGELAGLEQAWRSAVVLLALGAVALLLDRGPVDAAAVLLAPWASVAAVLGAQDASVVGAVQLTIGGALLVLRALTSPRRRHAAWAGGLLLAAATWVRLGDLGVAAPEAYTLPSAVVLLLVGLHGLRRTPALTTVRALLPGLVLGILPSLLWVLAGDPVSWRALSLGSSCFLLVLAGAWRGWQAPLVVGSAAGGLLVLRELAPYAAATPQWVLLGVAGLVLTLVGISWERRLRDLRVAGGYLARLR